MTNSRGTVTVVGGDSDAERFRAIRRARRAASRSDPQLPSPPQVLLSVLISKAKCILSFLCTCIGSFMYPGCRRWSRLRVQERFKSPFLKSGSRVSRALQQSPHSQVHPHQLDRKRKRLCVLARICPASSLSLVWSLPQHTHSKICKACVLNESARIKALSCIRFITESQDSRSSPSVPH